MSKVFKAIIREHNTANETQRLKVNDKSNRLNKILQESYSTVFELRNSRLTHSKIMRQYFYFNSYLCNSFCREPTWQRLGAPDFIFNLLIYFTGL